MENLLRAKDVAQLLNLRASTVYDLAHRRILPHIIIKKGCRRNLIRFQEEDVQQFIEQQKVLSHDEQRGLLG